MPSGKPTMVPVRATDLSCLLRLTIRMDANWYLRELVQRYWRDLGDYRTGLRNHLRFHLNPSRPDVAFVAAEREAWQALLDELSQPVRRRAAR